MTALSASSTASAGAAGAGTELILSTPAATATAARSTAGVIVRYLTFEPPTVNDRVIKDNGPLFERYAIPVGQSVVKVDGVYEVSPFPWIGELVDTVEGIDYFLGGHVYRVSGAVAEDLQAAGFTVTEGTL